MDKKTNMEVVWRFKVGKSTLESVNRDLKQIAEDRLYLKSMHIMGNTILLLAGYPTYPEDEE